MTADFRDDAIAALRAVAMLVELDAERLDEDPDFTERVTALRRELDGHEHARDSQDRMVLGLRSGERSLDDVAKARDDRRFAEVCVVNACRQVVERADWLRELEEEENGR